MHACWVQLRHVHNVRRPCQQFDVCARTTHPALHAIIHITCSSQQRVARAWCTCARIISSWPSSQGSMRMAACRKRIGSPAPFCSRSGPSARAARIAAAHYVSTSQLGGLLGSAGIRPGPVMACDIRGEMCDSDAQCVHCGSTQRRSVDMRGCVVLRVVRGSGPGTICGIPPGSHAAGAVSAHKSQCCTYGLLPMPAQPTAK